MQTLIVGLLVFFLSSCGKLLIPKKKIIWSDEDQMAILNCPIDSRLNDLHNKFLDFQIEAKDFVPLISYSKGLNKSIMFSSFSVDKTPLNPLILNTAVLHKSLEKMKSNLKRLKSIENFEIKGLLIMKLREEIESFDQYFVRYNNILCREDFFLSKQKQDVGPYYQVQNILDKQCFMKYECLRDELKKTPNDHLRWSFNKLCHEIIGEGQCQNDILDISENEFSQKIEKIMGQYKKLKIDPFYAIHSLTPKFNCSKEMTAEFSKNIMTIFMYSSEIILSELLLKNVENFWNTFPNLNIVLINSGEKKLDSIEIKLTDNGISYVEDHNPKVIYLSKNILKRKEILEITLAHELGHSLGLPDCYVEYLDHNLTAIYYHLDPDNLMCSLAPTAKITMDSLNRVFESRCR